MTSSNGNIFRVTGHLCGEFTGDRWIPRTMASDTELWCFVICAWINGWVNNREAGDLGRHRAHDDVIVMMYTPCMHGISYKIHSYIYSCLSTTVGELRSTLSAAWSFPWCFLNSRWRIVTVSGFRLSAWRFLGARQRSWWLGNAFLTWKVCYCAMQSVT